MKRCSPDIRSLAINQLVEADGGPDAIRKLAKTVLEMDAADPGGLRLNTAVRQSMQPNWKAALFQMRSAGLLSRPTTHVKNIFGNMGAAIGAIPERYLAAGISKAFHNGEIDFGEANAVAHGFIQGNIDGIKMVSAGKEAAQNPELADLYALNRPGEMQYTNHLVPEAFGISSDNGFGKGMAYALKAIDLPHQALQLEDDFFKSIAYRQELNALAYREAKKSGLEGDEFIQRYNDIKNNPPESLQTEAFDFAKYQTFTNDLGPLAKKVHSAINSNYLLKAIVPYFKTPVNIFKYTFERTPLALTSNNIRADIRAGGARAAQAEARIALGSTFLAVGGMMVLSGRLTGAGPQDQRKKKLLRQTGWQPYSVKVGDKWVSYNGLEPFGTLVGLGADIGELTLGLDQEDQETITAAGAMAIAQNLASKTYLSGAFDFMAALDDGNFKSTPEGWLMGQAQTFYPYSSALRGATRANDPILRDTSADNPVGGIDEAASKFINQMRAKIPGLSDSLPPRLDLWGNEINVSSGFGALYDFASPFAASVDNPNKIEQAILDNDVSVSWPQKTIDGVRLTPQQFHDYSKRAGELAEKNLKSIVSSSGFKGLSIGPEGMQAILIKQGINQARDIAKKEMIAKDVGLRNSIFKKKTEKAAALSGQ